MSIKKRDAIIYPTGELIGADSLAKEKELPEI